MTKKRSEPITDEWLKAWARIKDEMYSDLECRNVFSHALACRALLREVLAEAIYSKRANLSHDLIKRIKETLEG